MFAMAAASGFGGGGKIRPPKVVEDEDLDTLKDFKRATEVKRAEKLAALKSPFVTPRVWPDGVVGRGVGAGAGEDGDNSAEHAGFTASLDRPLAHVGDPRRATALRNLTKQEQEHVNRMVLASTAARELAAERASRKLRLQRERARATEEDAERYAESRICRHALVEYCRASADAACTSCASSAPSSSRGRTARPQASIACCESSSGADPLRPSLMPSLDLLCGESFDEMMPVPPHQQPPMPIPPHQPPPHQKSRFLSSAPPVPPPSASTPTVMDSSSAPPLSLPTGPRPDPPLSNSSRPSRPRADEQLTSWNPPGSATPRSAAKSPRYALPTASSSRAATSSRSCCAGVAPPPSGVDDAPLCSSRTSTGAVGAEEGGGSAWRWCAWWDRLAEGTRRLQWLVTRDTRSAEDYAMQLCWGPVLNRLIPIVQNPLNLWLVVFFLGGMAYYHVVEAWPLLDVTYFITITSTTVGYGSDFAPEQPSSRLLTCLYAPIGMFLVLAGFAPLASSLNGSWREKLLDRIFGCTEEKLDERDEALTLSDVNRRINYCRRYTIALFAPISMWVVGVAIHYFTIREPCDDPLMLHIPIPHELHRIVFGHQEELPGEDHGAHHAGPV
jgi:hypothetical protein